MNATEIILSLDVVARINLNDKLVTTDGFNIHPNSPWRAAARWWYAETRLRNYDALRSLLANAQNIHELFARRDDHTGARRVADAIRHALKGISNLAETYRDDVELHTKLTRLIRDAETAFPEQAQRADSPPDSPHHHHRS